MSISLATEFGGATLWSEGEETMTKREQQAIETRIGRLQTEAHHETRIAAVLEIRRTIQGLQGKLDMARQARALAVAALRR